MMEALACHPLDTIKVRMQLSKRSQRGVSFSIFFHPFLCFLPSPFPELIVIKGFPSRIYSNRRPNRKT